MCGVIVGLLLGWTTLKASYRVRRKFPAWVQWKMGFEVEQEVLPPAGSGASQSAVWDAKENGYPTPKLGTQVGVESFISLCKKFNGTRLPILCPSPFKASSQTQHLQASRRINQVEKNPTPLGWKPCRRSGHHRGCMAPLLQPVVTPTITSKISARRGVNLQPLIANRPWKASARKPPPRNVHVKPVSRFQRPF